MRQRASSPKLQVLNTALMTAPSGLSAEEVRDDREFFGRLVESAVGAHLANAAAAQNGALPAAPAIYFQVKQAALGRAFGDFSRVWSAR